MGLFEQVAEERRAADAATATGALGRDDRFWRNFSYTFVLKSPDGASFFPLVLNPERYSLTLPFAADVTATQEGGVFVEKHGIVLGKLMVEGHTGFKPRLNDAETGSPRPTVALSGQAHFLRLQRLCFERYSDLSKDPERGPRTSMEFHVFKDAEHVVVEPISFKLDRTREDRVLYRYTIEAHVLGRIAALPAPPAEDNLVIKRLANASAALEAGIAAIQAGILDLDEVQELREAVNDYDSIVGGRLQVAGQMSRTALGLAGDAGEVATGLPSEISRLTGAVSEFLRGTTAVIALPYDTVRQAQASLDEVIETVEAAANLPSDVVQILRQTNDALDVIGTYPERFVEPFPVAAQRFLDRVRGPAAKDQAELDRAAAATRVAQPTELQTTATRTGDLARVEGGVFRAQRTFPRYEGFREIRVRRGDTLARIAARELGDARRAPDLALANGLKDPYINNAGLPGTLRSGDPILVPTEERGGDSGQVRSAGDPADRASQLEVVLGRDLAIEATGSGRQFDLVVDTAGGSIDFKSTAGVDNMAQAVGFVLSVEQGDDVLYQQLGVERIIGKRGTLDRIVEAELRITETVLRDPRVAEVRNVRFEVTGAGDQFDVELDAVLIDNSQQRVIGRVIS